MRTAVWTRLGGAVAMLAALLLPASPAFPQATCNGLVNIDYTSMAGVNFLLPGDVVRVQVEVGTGTIQLGTHLTVNTLRFGLHCNSDFPLTVNCTEELPPNVEYEGDGTLTTTCPGITWTSGHPVAAQPNQVVFVPTPALVMPANQAVPPGFCNIEFNVKVLGPSTDGTPTQIEEVVGYLGNAIGQPSPDAACDNGLLVSGGFQTASLPLCPTCAVSECVTNMCNQTTGACNPQNVPDSTPCGDTDTNACTTAGCEAGSCVQTHLTTVCQPDTNEYTDDVPCNPQTGLCDHPPVADRTPCTDTDANAGTTAGCEAGTCVQGHVTTVCTPDTNQCTQDLPCNPQTGTCDHPPVPDSTPCTDSDANACTTAGCEAGNCVQTHQTTVCPPSPNECLENPPCNPSTGACDHPNQPDSTPCTDTDAQACTTAGCEMGTCVQAHISTCQGFTRTVGFWKNHPALTQSILT